MHPRRRAVATDGKPGTGKVKLTLSRGKKKIKLGSATQNGSKGKTIVRVR